MPENAIFEVDSVTTHRMFDRPAGGIMKIEVKAGLVKPFHGAHIVMYYRKKTESHFDIVASGTIQDAIDNKLRYELTDNEISWLENILEMILDFTEHEIELYYVKPQDFVTVMTPKTNDFSLKR